MAERKLKQIVYYGDNNKKNYPNNKTNSLLGLSSSINSITNIKNGLIERIGIQNYSDKSGTIYLKSFADLNEGNGQRVLRPREIYEVSFKEYPILIDFYFDQNFLMQINNNANDYLIIDIIYKI